MKKNIKKIGIRLLAVLIFIMSLLGLTKVSHIMSEHNIKKQLITHDTAKIEHIKYTKNKITYELSNHRSIIDNTEKTGFSQNRNKKHVLINKLQQQKLNKDDAITYKEEHIKQNKKIFTNDSLPLNGHVYTITEIKS